MGNDTETVDVRGEIKQDNRSNFGRYMDNQLQHNNTPLGYTYRTLMPAGGIATSILFPATTLRIGLGGLAGSTAANIGSTLATGKSWDDNVRNYVGSELAPMTNPGAWYGMWTGKNYSQLGRYTLDNLTPAGYGNYSSRLKSVYLKPLYQNPPSFANGRKPLWYDHYAEYYGEDAARNRFENGAIWAGIPESEVPRTMYVKNSKPNSYRMNEKGLNLDKDGNLDLIDDTFKGVGKYEDVFTKGGVGGAHSDYVQLGTDNAGRKIMQFHDEQKLNPQWLVADWLKERYNINENSKLGKVIDWFGGINISRLLGYKPFEIR